MNTEKIIKLMEEYSLEVNDTFVVKHHLDLGEFKFTHGPVPRTIVLVNSDGSYNPNVYKVLCMLAFEDTIINKTASKATDEQLRFIEEADRVLGIGFKGNDRVKARLWIKVHGPEYLRVLEESTC